MSIDILQYVLKAPRMQRLHMQMTQCDENECYWYATSTNFREWNCCQHVLNTYMVYHDYFPRMKQLPTWVYLCVYSIFVRRWNCCQCILNTSMVYCGVLFSTHETVANVDVST